MEDLGSAVLTLDADSGPLNTALGIMDGSVKERVTAMGSQFESAFGGKMKAAAAVGFGAVAVGAGLAGKALYDLGAEFDDAYDTIRTGTGATGDELAGLQEDFKDVFASVPTDSATAATAITELNRRLGVSGEPLRELSKQFIELSRLTGTDLKTNIETVSKAFVDWEVPVKKQTETLDGFFRLSQESGISVDKLATSVQQFGSPLRTLGFSLEESAAMFATFEKAGVNTSTMVPGLKLAIGNLVKPTDELKTTLEDLGINAKLPKDQLQQIFELLSGDGLSATEKMSVAMDVFGKRAGADMAEAIKQGRFEFDEMQKSFRKGDSIRDAAEDTNDLAENWKIFTNRLKVLFEPIAIKVFNAVNEGIQKVLDLFEELSEGSTDTAKSVNNVAEVIADAFKWMKDVVAKVLGAFMDKIKAVFKIVSGIIEAFDAAFRGDWGDLWKSIKKIASGVLDAIKVIVKSMFGRIFDVIKSIGGRIVDAVKSMWEKVKASVAAAGTRVIALVKAAWEKAKDAVVSVISRILEVVVALPGKLINALSDLASKLFNLAKDAFGRFLDGIKEKAEDAIDFVASLPGRIIDGIKGLPGSMFNKGEAAGQAFVNGLKSMIAGVNAIVEGINDSLDNINKKADGLKKKLGSSKRGASGMGAGHGKLDQIVLSHRARLSGAVGIDSPALARAAGASVSGAPQVSISFADGMGWLKQFVHVEVDGRDAKAHLGYRAGTRRKP